MRTLSSLYPTALVTGASSGLGAAFAAMLLSEGVKVWGTARAVERLAGLSGRPGFTPLPLDLGEAASVERAFLSVRESAGGPPSLVINNAGAGLFGPFAERAFAEWEAQVRAGLLGTARIAHLAMEGFRQAQQGCLVNVSSVAAVYPLPFMSGYNMVKAGVSALSESLLFETRGTAVTVIDFRPGDFRTAFNHSMQAPSSPQPPSADPRLARTWRVLEANLAAAPEADRAARDLRRALAARRRGTVYSGSFFQTRLAPLFSRLAPASLRRAVAARYFGAC